MHNPNWSKQMRYEGVWSPREVVEDGRKRGQKKLRSVNKERALAARYGFYKYPKRPTSAQNIGTQEGK